MNEVGMSLAHAALSARAHASSKGVEETQHSKDGKELPKTDEVQDVSTAKDELTAQEKPAESLDNVVATVNNYVQSIQRDLHFSVDTELEKTIVKVVDSDSGKLIRQIPEDVFLELARNLKQDGELQLVNAQG